MDPATISALVQLMSLGLQTFQQYSQGNISAEQATTMLNQAATNLQNAFDVFNKVTDGESRTGG